MEAMLERLVETCAIYTAEGRVAGYIPELSKADPGKIGVHIVASDGKHSWAGDHRVPFTLQSIVKPVLIPVTCEDLANIGYVLANRGRLPHTGERVFPADYVQYVNAILMTCGMYDGSGEFAIRVGVPAKSGVGGGIMAVVPTRMGIGIYSPALDSKGNSVAGIRMLEQLSKELYLSIF